MTPRGRAVAALCALAALGVGAWLAWPRPGVAPAPAPLPAGDAATTRAEALDRVEAREAETLGVEEAARRRRARERMLDLRSGEAASHAP